MGTPSGQQGVRAEFVPPDAIETKGGLQTRAEAVQLLIDDTGVTPRVALESQACALEGEVGALLHLSQGGYLLPEALALVDEG